MSDPTYIPATPGTHLFVISKGDNTVRHEAVIGWQHGGADRSATYPITMRKVYREDSLSIIYDPGTKMWFFRGSLLGLPEMYDDDDRAAWDARERAQHTRERARKAKLRQCATAHEQKAVRPNIAVTYDHHDPADEALF